MVKRTNSDTQILAQEHGETKNTINIIQVIESRLAKNFIIIFFSLDGVTLYMLYLTYHYVEMMHEHMFYYNLSHLCLKTLVTLICALTESNLNAMQL